MVTESIVKAGEIALDAEKRYREKQKIGSYVAVKIDVRVICECNGKKLYPPLKISVNDENKCKEINVPKTRGHGAIKGKKREPRTEGHIVWQKVAVRAKGPDKLRIVLSPINGAEKYFERGRSEPAWYEPAYSETAVAGEGKAVFKVPPDKDDDGYPAHVVRIVINPKRRLRKFLWKVDCEALVKMFGSLNDGGPIDIDQLTQFAPEEIEEIPG